MSVDKKKDCAFQYAWIRGAIRTPSISISGEVVVVEDTPLITYEEAKALWNKYLPDFIKRINDEESPEMCIWTDMNEVGDYRKDTHYINAHDVVVENGKLYKRTRTEVSEL